MKYLIETIWRKHEHFFSPNSVKTTKCKNTKNDANVSSTFLVEMEKLRQVTNTTRSNRGKSLINFLDVIKCPYKRQNRSTNLRTVKSVNNHSERRELKQKLSFHTKVLLC